MKTISLEKLAKELVTEARNGHLPLPFLYPSVFPKSDSKHDPPPSWKLNPRFAKPISSLFPTTEPSSHA